MRGERWKLIESQWKRTMTVSEYRRFKESLEYDETRARFLGKDTFGPEYGRHQSFNQLLWFHVLNATRAITLQESRHNEMLHNPDARETHAIHLAEDEMLALGRCPPPWKGVARCKSCGTVAHPTVDDGRVLTSCRWCNFPGHLNRVASAECDYTPQLEDLQ